jgi:SAM-dependent methyltransferase
MKRCIRCDEPLPAGTWACPSCGFEPPADGGFVRLATEEGADGFEPEAFSVLAALEARNFWFRARNRLIVWAATRYCPNPGRILEIGCGTGFVLSALGHAYPAAALSGSELFGAGLPFAAERLAERGDTELLQMDARNIPFRDHFDLIGAFDVIEHIEEDEKVLAQARQALTPGGVLLLSVPQHPWLWSAADEAARHVRRYTAGELRDKVQAAGFQVLYQTSFVSLLLPLLLASRRWAPKAESRRRTARDELQISGPANTLMQGVMTAERWLIVAGIRFPAGGSRLLAARREARP